MCKCKNIAIGSFDRQTVMWMPFASALSEERKEVSIDTCLVQEIAELWHLGIETIESCCGHNQTKGYILVVPDAIKKMKKLGYKNRHLSKYDTQQVFLPKTK